MADLEIPKNDFGYNLTFGLKDANDDAYDLTGYVVRLKVWPPGNTGGTIVNGTCTILNVEASGSSYYTIKNGDFGTVRNYVGELELTKSGVVESSKRFTMGIIESA